MPKKVAGITLNTEQLDKIAAGLDMNADQALRSLAFQAQAEAGAIVPVKTGNLKGSLEAEPVIKGKLWRVRDGTEYGLFVELGTSKQRSQPFLSPAIEKVKSFIAKEFKILFK